MGDVPFANAHVPEERHDAQVHAPLERPARDHVPLAVVDERDLARAVGEREDATRMDRDADVREECAARELDLAEGGAVALAAVKVIGRARPKLRLVEPRHRDRGDVMAREEDVESFEDGPGGEDGDREDGEGERQRAGGEAEGDPLRPLLDRVERERGQGTADVELRELGGGPVVECEPGATLPSSETERALGASRTRRIDAPRDAVDREMWARPDAPLAARSRARSRPQTAMIAARRRSARAQSPRARRGARPRRRAPPRP